MAILTPPDKEKVKRAVPKASNKVIDATVARLYIAYPDPTQWTYTGLSGAIALVDDLVGHTFFLKLVDIIGSQGVLWDQELYVDFQYSQDRKFFHTFETEDCLVGLLFEDTSDAAHFYKRVTTRHKHASKQTANNKNAVALKDRLGPAERKQGSRGEYVDVNTNQRSRRARGVLYYDDQPPPEWRSLYAELAAAGISEDMIAENREFIKDYIAKQGGPLVGLEPPVPRKYSTKQALLLFEPVLPATSTPSAATKKKKAPPPPPPAAGSVFSSPAETPSPSPTPAPQAPQAPQASQAAHLNTESRSSSESLMSPAQTTPSAAHPKFRLPPANAAIPTVSHTNIMPPSPVTNERPLPTLPPNASNQYGNQGANSYGQAQFGANAGASQYGQPQNQVHHVPPAPMARQGPPPPPRANARPGPPPPPRAGTAASTLPPQRTGGVPPPPPPRASRGPAPPPPPSRTSRPTPAPPQQQYGQQQAQYGQPQAQYGQQPIGQPQYGQQPIAQPQTAYGQQAPPQAPPQQTYQPPAPPQQSYQPPAPPQREYAAPPPPQRSNAAAPTSPVPAAQNAPAPPPLPQQTLAAPPPPPMANLNLGQATLAGLGAPPPPPPPPDLSAGTSGSTAALPQPDAGRDALLASIRGVGGIGALKKTDKSQLEKPSVLLLEARGEPTPAPSSGGGAPAAPGQPESLADALASALNKRKDKVAASDDEDDDDW